MNLRTIAIKLLSGELPPIGPAELGAERLKVCEPCDQFAKIARQCRQCSCFMDLKVKLLDATCPLDKW